VKTQLVCESILPERLWTPDLYMAFLRGRGIRLIQEIAARGMAVQNSRSLGNSGMTGNGIGPGFEISATSAILCGSALKSAPTDEVLGPSNRATSAANFNAEAQMTAKAAEDQPKVGSRVVITRSGGTSNLSGAPPIERVTSTFPGCFSWSPSEPRAAQVVGSL
jgi:hypothetical protein